MSKRFEQLEHTADILVRAYGDSLGEAFASSAEALFAVMTDDATISGPNAYGWRYESDDLESLLVKFLSDMLAVHEIERVVLGDFTVVFIDDTVIEVNANGESFDVNRHGRGHHVKGISYHLMEIDKNSPCSVQVLFDV